MRSGSPPMRRIASRRLRPFHVRSRSPALRSPATMRLQAVPRPNAVLSSCAHTTISSGRRVTTPAAATACSTSSAASVPRSPSKLPPLGTESMCEPSRIGGAVGGPPVRAKMFPAASRRGSRPAARISPAARRARPGRPRSSATRLTPSAKVPPAGRPKVLRRSRRRCSRSGSIAGEAVRARPRATVGHAHARPPAAARKARRLGMR